MNTSQQKAFELFGAAMTALKAEPEKTGYIGTREACAYLNIERTFLWMLNKKGLIKSYVLGKRRLYKREDLDCCVQARSERVIEVNHE